MATLELQGLRKAFGRTEVLRLEHDGKRWRIETSTGERDDADVVIAATGVLHHPRYPDIEGLDDFAGPVFHSARWDHTVPLAGARLGVIGTGSSAVQVTGAVSDLVRELHLFQRTPQWILPVGNPPIDDADRARYRSDPAAMTTLRAELNTSFVQTFANAVVDADSAPLKTLQKLACANLEDSVADRELREKLRPDYRAGCKRLIISPNFYHAIQRPNAHLVTEAIARVEADGVRTVDGRLHGLDVLVLATGFRVDRFLRPIDVIGRGGVRLDEVWRERPFAYLSVSVPDFPNLFMLNGPNGPVGNFSLIEVAEIQFRYVMRLVERIRALQIRELVNSDQCASHEPHDMVERAGVFINNRIRAEQTLVPRAAAAEVAHCQRDVGDRREIGHHGLLSAVPSNNSPAAFTAQRIVRWADLQSA